MVDFDNARRRMVSRQIARRGISDQNVLRAMREVPRECFVEDDLAELAYEDTALPIAAHQTISQPLMVAMMIAEAEVTRDDRVLEIGTGSGYAAAVLSRIAKRVFTVERISELKDLALERFEKLGYSNIEARLGNGTIGWLEEAPFDAIIVAAGSTAIPQALIDQLRLGGRLIIPVGHLTSGQRLRKIVRCSATEFQEMDLGNVQFVPLIGAEG